MVEVLSTTLPAPRPFPFVSNEVETLSTFGATPFDYARGERTLIVFEGTV
jgi:hypothetical protein